MKIRKNALMLSVIAMLLIPAFAIAVKPSFGQLSTMLTVDTVDAPGLAIGELFAVNVYVVDVEAMFGYQFDLGYDTSVIMATGLYGSYTPFSEEAKTVIDTANGVISTGFSMPSPELDGFYWIGAYPIFWAEFQVVDPSASPFALSNTKISDIHGNPIGHGTTDGWFRNAEGAPIAWFAPPEPALGGVLVSFMSLSTDPEGTIDAFDWNWGDGTAHGTTASETHAWATEGTYTVTLTVTDNDANTDTQSHPMYVTPPPLAGAIAIRGLATQKYLDFTKYGSHKQWLKGWVKNIDPTRTTLVRVDLDVYSAVYEIQLGAVATPNQWLGPGVLGTFQGVFDMMDPKWKFVQGAARTGFDEFTVVVNVFYADFFYNGDPNNPHWAQVPDAPLVSYTFGVHETKAVPVPVATQTGPNTVFADGTGSYDVDAKWGDSILGYRWLVYDVDGNLLYLVFGSTYTFNLDPGYYEIGLRVEDSFGTRRSAWTDITVV
jgi:PKD repeat protein